MLNDKALEELLRGEVNKTGGHKQVFRCAIIDLRDRPILTAQDLPGYNPHCRIGRLDFSVAYFEIEGRSKNERPFALCLGLTDPYRIRVKDWEEFNKMANDGTPNGEVIAWVLRNTNINEEMFEVAKKNVGIKIAFYFDIVEYMKKIYKDVDEADSLYINGKLNEEISKLYRKIYREEKLKQKRERERLRKLSLARSES